MYCVKCGVELADSEPRCPLCGTEVFHPKLPRPEGTRPFPPFTETHEEFNRNGTLFLLTFLFLLPLLLCLVCDLSVNNRIGWSGYVAGALELCYTIVVLPLWFRRPDPVIFVAADFVALGLLLLYINHTVNGNWFVTLALPVTGAAAVITVGVVALVRYLRRGYLYIFGGALVLTGFALVLTEALIDYTFTLHRGLLWCRYPLLVLSLLGLMLLIIAVCPPLRDSLHKKFFL